MDRRPSGQDSRRCEACERAEELSLGRARFVARLGHTLRTPLNGIQGFSQILSQEGAGPLNDQQRRQIERIEEAGRRLLSLIDGLADLSRIQAGEMTPEASPTDVATVMRRALEQHRAEAEAKGVSIALEGVDEPLAIETDAEMLTAVLSELLSNAIRHGPKGGHVQVTVAVRDAGHAGNGTLVFRVVDSGPGIEPDELRRLTTDTEPPRDAQVRSQRSGLGLVVTQRLVELLGGRLEITSELGEGTRAQVELPRSVTAHPRPAQLDGAGGSAEGDQGRDTFATVTQSGEGFQ